MHAGQFLPWSLALSMTSHSMCNYRFSSDASWFIDYAEAARACPQSKLTTHPNLGLLDQIYGSDDKSPGESRGWAGLARHVQDLNDKNYPGVVYKILLVVRHGRGVHNVVMDEVGSAEWKVSSAALLVLRMDDAME